MKKIIAVLIAVIVFATIAAMPCRGDDQYSDEDLRVFEGKVVNVDVGGSVLTVKGVIQIDFPISLDTKLFRHDADTKLSGINVGDYVTVQYYRSGSESRVPEKVVRVTVETWS